MHSFKRKKKETYRPHVLANIYTVKTTSVCSLTFAFKNAFATFDWVPILT